MAISDKLKALREQYELNKVQMSERIGVASFQYGRWEFGTVQPDANSILKISKAFDVPIDWLLKEDESEVPNAKPDGDRIGNFLYKTPDGKDVCTKKFCEWRHDCGDGKFTCPGKSCICDNNFAGKRESKLMIWLVKMFALLNSHDI